ncbi:MAG: hypothetical protein J0L55_13940 [Caulobacterales bacterium]|nr:hypothetical protein [Caulobacterales bacterium]
MSEDIQEQIAALKEQVAQLEKKAAAEKAKPAPLIPEIIPAPEPVFQEDPIKTNNNSIVLVVTIAIVGLLLFAFSSNSSKKGGAPANTNVVTQSDNDATDSVAKAAEEAIKTVEEISKEANAAANTAPAVNSETKWEYSSSSDGMSDVQTKTACVVSEDMIMQSAPYEPTHTRLCFRKSPKYGFDAYFVLESGGQILCHSYVEPCTITVRFDKNAAQSFSGGSSSDNSTDIVFFQNAQRLLNSVLKSKQTRVQVELFQNGNQVTTFNTSGLVWPPKQGAYKIH